MRFFFGAAVLVAMVAILACGGGSTPVPTSTPLPPTQTRGQVTLSAPTQTVKTETETPVATAASNLTTASPRPTPGPFAISPEATQVPIPPSLLRISPDQVVPGGEIELEGTGGHIELRTADGSRIGYIESAKSFPVFLDGENIGSVVCFLATCRGPITVPIETLPGTHRISMEGGSDVLVEVIGEGPQTPETGPLAISSGAFSDGQPIPLRFSCDGEDISLQLMWTGVPAGTRTLALIMDDPDAPGGTWDHWVVFNIPADSPGLEENQPDSAQLPNGGFHGKNSWGDAKYGGPCPPRGSVHTYRFLLYAVDEELMLESGASKSDVLASIKGHVIAEALFTGTFGR